MGGAQSAKTCRTAAGHLYRVESRGSDPYYPMVKGSSLDPLLFVIRAQDVPSTARRKRIRPLFSLRSAQENDIAKSIPSIEHRKSPLSDDVYFIVLCYIVLYYTILYHIILYCIILYYSYLHSIQLYRQSWM